MNATATQVRLQPRERHSAASWQFGRGVVCVGLLVASATVESLSAKQAEDDLLPPLLPSSVIPLDWAAWRTVTEFAGRSRVEFVSQKDEHHSDDGSFAVRHDRQVVVVDFKLIQFRDIVEDPGSSYVSWNYEPGSAKGYGDFFFTGSDNCGDNTRQGSYIGPMNTSASGLRLDLQTGTWQLDSLDSPDSSWSERNDGWTICWRNGERDEFSELTTHPPGGSLGSAGSVNFEGEASKIVVPFGGRDSITIDDPDTYSSWTRTGQIDVWPVFNDIEVIVEVENLFHNQVSFQDWRPEGALGFSEIPGPNPLLIKARLRPKAEHPTPAQLKALPKVRRFRFELGGTSYEPGICMNFDPDLTADGPVKTEDPEFDLRFSKLPFYPTVLSPLKQKAGVESSYLDIDTVPPTLTDIPRAAVRLDSYDFGAYADLRVYADLEDGRSIAGYITAPDGVHYIVKIPDRPEGSLIARKWRNDHSLTNADAADEDDEPVGDGQKGDGFSNYEEYRGFMVHNTHYSTDPSVKDLFIRNNCGPIVSVGCRLLEQHSAEKGRRGLKIWDAVLPEEIPSSRVMNLYRSPKSPGAQSEPQHGLLVEEVAVGKDFIVSHSQRAKGSVKRPKNVKRIGIDTRDDDVVSVVAHEILHSIGVEHHGDNDIGPVRWDAKWIAPPNAPFKRIFMEQRLDYDDETGTTSNLGKPYPIRVFSETSRKELTPDHPNWRNRLPTTLYVAARGGRCSGDEECVMRYRIADAYVPGPPSSFDRVTPSTDSFANAEWDPHGDLVIPRLCKSCLGTGINPNRFGHAPLGDCFHQLCVRDSAPQKSVPANQCPNTGSPFTPAKP